jgi:hypothetical protein
MPMGRNNLKKRTDSRGKNETIGPDWIRIKSYWGFDWFMRMTNQSKE